MRKTKPHGRKKTKARPLPGEGMYFEFHGAFKSEAAAKKRERAKHGFTVTRTIRGKRRFVVMVPKESPF